MAKLFKQSDFTSSNTISLASVYDRLNGYPLSNTAVWDSKSGLESYAKTQKAYVGEIVTLANSTTVTPYFIDYRGNIKEVGSSLTSLTVSSDATINGNITNVKNISAQSATLTGNFSANSISTSALSINNTLMSDVVINRLTVSSKEVKDTTVMEINGDVVVNGTITSKGAVTESDSTATGNFEVQGGSLITDDALILKRNSEEKFRITIEDEKVVIKKDGNPLFKLDYDTDTDTVVFM